MNFYGSLVNDKLKYLSVNDKQIFIKEANLVYQRAIDYLSQWFDYKNSYFKKFKILNLDNDLNYNDVNEITKLFNISIEITF